MKTLREFMEETADHPAYDHAGKPITVQDIRLYAGEGKLSKKTVKQAVDIIKKHRAESKLV